MFTKRFLAIIFMLFVLAMCCTACSTSKEQADNTESGIESTTGKESNSANTNTNVNENKRVGNSNSNIANGGWIDEENGWLYYSLKDGLYKCKEDGTQKEKLLDDRGGVYSINVIDDWIYFRSFGIYKVKTDGTGYTQITAEDERGGVHFVGDKIYNGIEYRMDFDGSNKEHIYDKNSASGYTMNIAEGWIYYYDTDLVSSDDKIYKMRLDGSDKQAIFDGRTDHMIVDGDWIYFSNNNDGKRLYKMKTDGTESQVLVDTGVTTILVCDEWVYYTSGALYKIKIDGSENQLLSGEAGTELQLQGDWLYYTLKDDIYRIKTDGTEHQLFASMGEAETTPPGETSGDSTEVSSDIVLNHSYETRFGDANSIAYPSFTIEYPSNWMVSDNQVSPTDETIVFTNERGVEIKYSYIGGIGNIGPNISGTSTVLMLRVEATKAADASFVPTSVQGTDYSDLGEFAVAKLKTTGSLNMMTDADFTDEDGAVSYAVLPESRLGIHEAVRGPFEGEFAFWYSGYISLIAKSPDGQFTAQEEQEVIAILASFRNTY